MLIFVAIAIASFLIVAGSFFFGHDHDTDHSDMSHDVFHDAEPTIGFFSVKVIATLTMGFGAAGAIARFYGADYIIASLIGIGSGGIISFAMLQILQLIYKQQSSSLVETATAIGHFGTVTTEIPESKIGEVSLSVAGQYSSYTAKSATGKFISKGKTVKVVNVIGSQLVVEEVK
jgi:membrane-bound ClpP family serine protease